MRGKKRFDVTEVEFLSLLGLHIAEYLSRIPDTEVSVDVLYLLGGTESLNDE